MRERKQIGMLEAGEVFETINSSTNQKEFYVKMDSQICNALSLHTYIPRHLPHDDLVLTGGPENSDLNGYLTVGGLF